MDSLTIFRNEFLQEFCQFRIEIKRHLSLIEQNQNKIFDKIFEIEERLDSIDPRPYLPSTPKPSQKETGRTPNVACIIRKWITIRNQHLVSSKKYLQLSPDVSDTVLNSGAKQCIRGYMALHLTSGWEQMSWGDIYSSRKCDAERVIQASSRDRTMVVFSQCSAQWAIRMLADQAQKSNQRGLKRKNEPKMQFEENEGTKRNTTKVSKTKIFIAPQNVDTEQAGGLPDQSKGVMTNDPYMASDINLTGSIPIKDTLEKSKGKPCAYKLKINERHNIEEIKKRALCNDQTKMDIRGQVPFSSRADQRNKKQVSAVDTRYAAVKTTSQVREHVNTNSYILNQHITTTPPQKIIGLEKGNQNGSELHEMKQFSQIDADMQEKSNASDENINVRAPRRMSIYNGRSQRDSEISTFQRPYPEHPSVQSALPVNNQITPKNCLQPKNLSTNGKYRAFNDV